MRTNAAIVPAWLLFSNGVAIAVAGFYALLFLPLLPVAIPAILIGIGLLPLAPLAAVACAIGLNAGVRRRYGRHRGRWPWRAGAAAGLALLLALDIPAAATRLGVQWAASEVASERERGLTLLRLLGDDDLLLRLCYDVVGRPTGVLSALVLFGGNALLEPRQNQLVRSPEVAREIYYRVHGLPFNIKPVPFDKGRWSRFADIQSDSDHGAAHVGGRVKGLEIASSRIDGSVSGGDAVAYLEWTTELRNSSPFDREARLQLALPPGGVVSRATLWVNGEEREAAVAGRGEVRAAYRRVAVVQRRDPLLVTTKGGALYTVRIPLTAPMKPIVKVVRTSGFAAFESLVAQRCGATSTLLTGFDNDTKTGTVYAVSKATGTTTVIKSFGSFPAGFYGSVHFLITGAGGPQRVGE